MKNFIETYFASFVVYIFTPLFLLFGFSVMLSSTFAEVEGKQPPHFFAEDSTITDKNRADLATFVRHKIDFEVYVGQDILHVRWGSGFEGMASFISEESVGGLLLDSGDVEGFIEWCIMLPYDGKGYPDQHYLSLYQEKVLE